LSGLQKTQDVKLELCEITREAVRLDKEKLLPGVVLVRSGVVQLAELQRQGFAYIKVE
jgi:intracellular sulfur oxidation DsrE/DsrF family protein